MKGSKTQRSEAQPPTAVGMSDWLGLFAGHHYYPRGGADDFRCFGSSEEELKRIYAENAAAWSRDDGGYPDPWGQIVDLRTMKVLSQTDGVNWNSPNDGAMPPPAL
jgi:hypothetical protein